MARLPINQYAFVLKEVQNTYSKIEFIDLRVSLITKSILVLKIIILMRKASPELLQKNKTKSKTKKSSKNHQDVFTNKIKPLSKESSAKKRNDCSLNLRLDLSHKNTKSSCTKNETFIKSDLVDFASSGHLPSKSKIKMGRGHKKQQYFSTRVDQIQKKKRYQPTPILTPIISQRNSNCPTTIRQIEDLNNKDSLKITMLKNYINEDEERIKTAKKRVDPIDANDFIQKNHIQANKLKEQLKNYQFAIEQSARKYRSLVNTHKTEMEILNKQMHSINEKLIDQVNRRTKLQKQLQKCQLQVNQSKIIIKQKRIQIQQIKHDNLQINNQNCDMKQKIDKFSNKVCSLQNKIEEFQTIRKQMELKLKKAGEEKKHIKNNTQDVLRMLRQDFGYAFGKITKQPKETQEFLCDLNRNY